MNAIRFLPLRLLVAPALAQDKGTLERKPLPPLANPTIPRCRQGALRAQGKPGALPGRAIGRVCARLRGRCQALPEDGDTWQVMRLSRNRTGGHPTHRLHGAPRARVPQINGWPGS
jgi:penicillin-insensitive murein endopeptidase